MAGFIGVAVNLNEFLRSTDPKEAMDYRNDVRVESLLLLFAVLFLAAGIGIIKSRIWGFFLALGLAVATVMYSLIQNSHGFSDYHDFTIALPMFVILIWGMFPDTWALFRRQEAKPL